MSMGITLYALFIVHNLLLGGFIVEKKMMPESLHWLIYSSYFYYGFQALVFNEFEHKYYGHGRILDQDFDKVDKWANLYILIAHWVVCLIVTFLLLKFANKEMR